MTQRQLQILKMVFWTSLGLTVIALLGSITDRVVKSGQATRTQTTGDAPIAVPADSGH